MGGIVRTETHAPFYGPPGSYLASFPIPARRGLGIGVPIGHMCRPIPRNQRKAATGATMVRNACMAGLEHLRAGPINTWPYEACCRLCSAGASASLRSRLACMLSLTRGWAASMCHDYHPHSQLLKWRVLGQAVLVYFALPGHAVTAQDMQPGRQPFNGRVCQTCFYPLCTIGAGRGKPPRAHAPEVGQTTTD